MKCRAAVAIGQIAPVHANRYAPAEMGTSLVYRNAVFYEAIMRALYGRHYGSRFRAIAGLIPDGASVLDVCCGPARLYLRYLKQKSVRYVGLDINERFIARLNHKGVTGKLWDVHSAEPLPEADYVVMQASLYHFLPDPSAVVGRMLRAARKNVIVAEPVRNLSDSRIPLLSLLARAQTDAGAGSPAGRFTETSLHAFFEKYARQISRSFLIPGGREKLYVLQS
jgi:SAM-dependent methyltransferase